MPVDDTSRKVESLLNLATELRQGGKLDEARGRSSRR